MSYLPGLLEGAPFHNDDFMLSFNSEANVTPTAVFIGALVTPATDADFTCKVTHTDEDFVLGVAQTSGQLQSPINVIVRGVVSVQVDASVTAGDLLYASDAHDGMATNAGEEASQKSRMVALQTVNGSGTPALCLVLLY